MDEMGVDDATETIQRVWRGFLGRKRGARMQLNRERDKMRSKQHKKNVSSSKDANNRFSHNQHANQVSRTNESVERRSKVHDVDDSTMYDQPDVIVYKAVKRGTNIGSYERKSNNVPKGGRMNFNNEESEDDVLHDSLEGPLRPAEKRNAVPSSPSPVYIVDDSLIHSHLSVIAEEDEMIRDSLSGTGILSNLSRSSQPTSTHQASPKVVLRKSAGKSNAVVADSLEGPQSFRMPPRLERQTSSRTQSSRSASRNDDGVDTEAEEVQTGRRSSEADSIEYGQFIKTDHNYDDVIAGLGDDYNAWDDLDREETELDNAIMDDSLRRSRNFQNDLVLAGLKHANEVIKSEMNRQPHSRSAPRSRGGSQDLENSESNRREDSAIPRFTSRKSTGHLKAFDSDGSLSQRTDSHGAHTNDLNTPPRGGPKQNKFSPEKPYVPSVRDLLAVSPEPPRRQDHGIASDVPRLNLAREAPAAPKSMLSRLEQAQQMYEANVKKNFPAQNVPKGQSNLAVQQPEGYGQHDQRDYSVSPVPLSSRSNNGNNGADRSPRRVPPVLLPSGGAQNQGLRGPSPRLQHFHEAPSPTPSQQGGYGYQHAQAHPPLTQRGAAGEGSFSQQAPQGQGHQQQQQGYQQQGYQQQGYQEEREQGYEQEVLVPKSIRLAPAPSGTPQPEQRAQQPALQPALRPTLQPLAQPAAQRQPPQFPGQVQNEAPARAQPAAPKQAAGGYFAAYNDSQQQNKASVQQPLQAAPAVLAPVAGRFSNLPSKMIPAAVARAPVKAAPAAVASKNANGRPKDMSQTKLTELQEQKLLEEIEELNRIQLQKLQELAQIEQNEKNAAAAAAAAVARSNSPRKRAADPVREKEKRAFKAGAKDVNPTPVLVKLKSKPSAGAARGVEEWSEAAQRDQPRAGSNVRDRNGLALNAPGYGNGVNQAPSPTPIQPLLAPPTGVDIHGGLNPGGFAAGAGYLQVYKKKQEVGQRGNSNPRGRRGNGEDNASANGDAQSEGRLFNRRQNAAPQYAQPQYEETASLPAIPSARNVKSSGSARVGGQRQAQVQGGNYYEEEPEAPLNPQFVHPLDGQNRRVLNASRNNTMSAPSRLLDEQQGGGNSSNMNGNMNGNGYVRAPDRNALPELGKVSHDYGMPSQLPVPMYNMQKKVAPMKGYSKR